MQTVLEVHRLTPRGTKVLVKRGPIETHKGRIEIPEAHRDRNKLQGELYNGIAIAVGPRTKAARFGRDGGYFQPGDKIHFWHMWDWKDHEVVLKDKSSGDSYLLVDESDIKAFEAAS